AVLKALNLDEKLERGWVNLEQIAGARSEKTIIEAVKSRHLAALPSDFTSNSLSVGAASEGMQTASNESLSPKLGLALELTTQETQADSGTMQIAKSEENRRIEPLPAKMAPYGPIDSVNEAKLVQKNTNQITGGKFVLVSANREVSSNGGTIEIYSANSAEVNVKNERQTPVSAVRVEVSNGNGVGGFARKFSSQLRSNKMLVTRITNYHSYSVNKTKIQYDPLYEDVARKLMSQLELSGSIAPNLTARAGVNIRIVLGRDAVQSHWKPNKIGRTANI
ncbi:MAG TPA: LytR C-terminal domain-containing protein, partial [Azonexus sp.]|nr:LytR C-terminal domain-containing protein [Azonexus sp.]